MTHERDNVVNELLPMCTCGLLFPHNAKEMRLLDQDAPIMMQPFKEGKDEDN